jgi:transcription initiation factor TFIID subunit 8
MRLNFCSQNVDATHFLSHVTASMLAARRSAPTPLDFRYALRREGLTARLLKPHLKPPIPADKIKPLFSIVPQEEQVYQPAAGLLGEDLNGESDKRTKAYIPKQFPSFPSKHTYKSTEVKLDRETDPRKIREKATEEARHGEEALRRLVKVGKTGDQKYARRGMENAAKPQKRHEMWEEAMEDLATGKPPTRSFGGGDGTDEQSILVNAEKPYTRRPMIRRKGLA